MQKVNAEEKPIPTTSTREYPVHVTEAVVAEKMLPYPGPTTCLIENLRTNGAEQDKRKRRISLDRINTKLIKRRQSQPVIPSYLTIGSPKVSEKKARKAVKFPPSVLVKQVVTDGDVEELKDLLAKHGNKLVDVREPNGLPLILRAILEDHLDCLEVLLAAGSNISARDAEDWNAFHIASSMDNLDAARMILDAAGQHTGMTQSRNADGERAIDLADSLEMSRLLLHADLAEFRLNCHTVGTEHTSYPEDDEAEILHLVKECYETRSTSMALNTVLKENTCYSSLLHMAAIKNYTRLADYVCTNSVPSLEIRDKKGWTPLHTAAYYNNVEMALFLVESGANIHTITRSYQKPSDLTEHEVILSMIEQVYTE